MRKDLLIRGAEVLEADAADEKGVKFNLKSWVSPAEGGTGWDGYRFVTAPETIPVDCGTSACAMGLFCITGTFKDEGLSYTVSESDSGFAVWPVLERDGERNEEFWAAAELFDIDLEVAEQLFSPDSYKKVKGAEAELAVAKRMRDLANGVDILHCDYEG